MQVQILGAGVVGLVCATELLNRGIRVTVIEKSQHLWDEACSWFAGGMLAPWCERESAEPPVLEWGKSAAEWWQRHVDGVSRNGTLVLAHARDAADLRRFANRTTNYRVVDEEQIRTLEPDLSGRFQWGLYFPEEAHLDPRLALARLATGIRAGGGEILLGVDGVSHQGQADFVVDCRGLAARDRLKDLRGVRGEMLVVRSSEIRLTRPVRLLHPRIPLYVVPRGDGLFMVGATMIESDERRRVSARSVLELLGALYSLHSGFGEAEVMELGADVRPSFPDNLPRVHRDGSTLFVNGLYRHGFLLAPAMAVRVAQSLTELNPS